MSIHILYYIMHNPSCSPIIEDFFLLSDLQACTGGEPTKPQNPAHGLVRIFEKNPWLVELG